jgi:putative DNA methylase
MMWDFVESGVWGDATGSVELCLQWVLAGLSQAEVGERPADVRRGSATSLPWPDSSFDAVITDPPYYDNVPYADISDFFYVWLRRSIGHLYSEHFAAEGTPKKSEVVADATRHGGSKEKARKSYERMMALAFAEGHRVLKPDGQMVVVYAHKTTLGWSTLVDALRQACFTVTEAWPLDTEMKVRLRGMESAALASSIFLVARKREGAAKGNYEAAVRPELEMIVRERVATLWDAGVSGADLVIACVGAGLRAFTRFARVEYANGDEVPAARFLTEVETVVLEDILGRLSKEVGPDGTKYSLVGLDAATRFYVLWRYTYTPQQDCRIVCSRRRVWTGPGAVGAGNRGRFF